MKIDQVIERLKEIREKEGNLEVQIAAVRSTWQVRDGIACVYPLLCNPGLGVQVGMTMVGEHRDPEIDTKSVFITGEKPPVKRKKKLAT